MELEIRTDPINDDPVQKVEKFKARLDQGFTSTGLNEDVMNALDYGAVLLNSGYPFEDMPFVQTYQKYFETHTLIEGADPKEITRYIMERSDPEAVKNFDAVVQEFNDDLPRVRQDDDKIAFIHFYNNIHAIVQGKGHHNIPEIITR